MKTETNSGNGHEKNLLAPTKRVQTATKANKTSKLSDWIDVRIPAPIMRQYRAMAERCNVPLEIALQVGVSLGLQSKFGIPKHLADKMEVKVY